MDDRLEILHDFYRPQDHSTFAFDMQQGHDSGPRLPGLRPDIIECRSNYMKLGDQYCQVMYLKDYASYIKDQTIVDIASSNQNLMLLLFMAKSSL